MNPPFPFRHGKYAVVHTSYPFATTPIPHASGVNSTVVRAKLNPSVWTSLADAAPPNSTTDHFAIKISKPDRLREALHEREFLSALKKHDVCHRHILPCYTCFAHDDKLHFVMDLANGHLDDFMATRLSAEMNVPSLNSPLNWLLTQFHGLAEALNCIHKPGITLMGWHHDIKPENILYFETEEHGIEFRIADWTTAEICTFTPHMVRLGQREPPGSMQVGWPAYLPFETLVGETGCAPDVWSLGCVFLEMLVWVEKGYAALDSDADGSLGFRQRRREEVGVLKEELRARVGNVGEARSEDFDVFYREGGTLLRVVEAELRGLRKEEDGGRWNEVLDLVGKMLESEDRARPTAEEVCNTLSRMLTGQILGL